MRLKIIGGNLVFVLLVGLGSYFYVKDTLTTELTDLARGQMEEDRQLVDRSWRLEAYEFTELVRDRAAQPELSNVFRALDEDGRRTRAYERANGIAAWFQDPLRMGSAPDIVCVVDETGRVVARDGDINRMNGNVLTQSVPRLSEVLSSGEAVHDAWFKEDENKLFHVGMAPIRNDGGGVIGGLVVGYDISNALAEREARLIGRDVAFVYGDSVYSSSLEQATAGALGSYLFGDGRGATEGAFNGQVSAPFELMVGKDHWSGVVASVPATPSVAIGYVVLANETAAIAPVAVANVILMLMIVGVLLVLVYGFVIGGSLMRPLEEIEEGILTVINGRTDFRIDVASDEFGGLAYRVNQLINMFTGVEETDSEGHTIAHAEHFEPVSSTQASAAGGGGGSKDGSVDDTDAAAKLASEPEADYHERIYAEYVAAKQGVGEDVSNIPKDKFILRLQKNAANLTKKHQCRMVRFQVQTKGSQVILRPVIIR